MADGRRTCRGRDRTARSWIARPGAAGQVVDVDVLGRSGDALRTLAQQHAIPRLLWLHEEGIHLLTANSAQARALAGFLRTTGRYDDRRRTRASSQGMALPTSTFDARRLTIYPT
ncbi:MAG: hypothetical protein IPO15_03020 [Anaerolineae bacterium]|uniref:hypothetical protein n=1 Tax=Candidatus Amarolinea dominans TaxID=3140696 RepID=UPI003135F755|nr:hypothetical protein [Anaerolineae bacterium]